MLPAGKATRAWQPGSKLDVCFSWQSPRAIFGAAEWPAACTPIAIARRMPPGGWGARRGNVLRKGHKGRKGRKGPQGRAEGNLFVLYVLYVLLVVSPLLPLN